MHFTRDTYYKVYILKLFKIEEYINKKPIICEHFLTKMSFKRNLLKYNTLDEK